MYMRAVGMRMTLRTRTVAPIACALIATLAGCAHTIPLGGYFEAHRGAFADRYSIRHALTAREVLPARFDEVRPEEEMALLDSLQVVQVREGGRWGLVELISGQVLLPSTYDEIQPFKGLADPSDLSAVLRAGSSHYASVGLRGADGRIRYGIVDVRGKLVVPLKYDEARVCDKEVARVGVRGNEGQMRYGFIDIKTDTRLTSYTPPGPKPVPCKYFSTEELKGSVVELPNGEYAFLGNDGRLCSAGTLAEEKRCDPLTAVAIVWKERKPDSLKGKNVAELAERVYREFHPEREFHPSSSSSTAPAGERIHASYESNKPGTDQSLRWAKQDEELKATREENRRIIENQRR